MRHDVYEIKRNPKRDRVLEEMRQKIVAAESFGVTLQGNRLTLRWRVNPGSELKQVHMVILDVDDGEDLPEPEES